MRVRRSTSYRRYLKGKKILAHAERKRKAKIRHNAGRSAQTRRD